MTDCEHHYWQPMQDLMLCYKCGNKIQIHHELLEALEKIKYLYLISVNDDKK